jgi:DNA-binding transcriptional LysR family regulator
MLDWSAVTFDHLRLYRDIVQSRSVSKGASLNGISQSAASQSIQELEKDLDVELLDRSTRPLTVTPAGRLYFEFCREVLHRLGQFEAELQAAKGETAGTIRVAAIYSVVSEMAGLEVRLAERCPQAHLSVDYLRPEKVYEAVLNDRSDIGLVSYPVSTREISVIPWREEEMVVGMAPSHPLATRTSVAPAELEGLDFVGFDEDLPIRKDVDRFLREQNVEVNVIMHFDNIQSLKEALTLGQGVSILPERMMHADIELGRLVAVHLQGDLHRPLGIIHRRRKRFSPVAEEFLALLEAAPMPTT